MADEKQLPKVWHVEDDRSWQGIVARALTKNGYSVTTTGTAREAREMIPDQVAGFSVAILDGNLEQDPYGVRAEGEEIAKLLKENRLPIGIIGLSSEITPWANVSLDKAEFKRNELLAAVAQLIEQQSKEQS